MAASFPTEPAARKEWLQELVETAHKVASRGKGILAADESTGTIGKRFAGINVENNEANRAAYRHLLFTTKGLGKHISGAILYEETLYQSHKGSKMVDLLKAEDIVVGIKVDMGLTELPATGEKATQGLDGLSERCAKYYEAGARFAKWRAVVQIDHSTGKPSCAAIQETAHTLARYAAICQANKLVPIVEPEILTDGAHTIQQAAADHEKVLSACFAALQQQGVILEGCLLKPAMVTPGHDCPTKSSPEEIAFYTVRTLSRTVPPALVGVMFLSGGQTEEEASLNLNAMNAMKPEFSWVLSFSYGRALQASVLKAWEGKEANVSAAQEALLHRARANSEAQLGKYKGGVQSSGSLFEKNYVY